MQQGFDLSRCICKKHYVICVVCILNCFCRYHLLLAFFNLKPFSFIRSVKVLIMQRSQIINRYSTNVFLCRTLAVMLKKSISIRWAKLDFCVTIEHHYGCNSFFRETISLKYLLHLSSVKRIKCLGEMHKQEFCLKIFCTNSYDLTDC